LEKASADDVHNVGHSRLVSLSNRPEVIGSGPRFSIPGKEYGDFVLNEEIHYRSRIARTKYPSHQLGRATIQLK